MFRAGVTHDEEDRENPIHGSETEHKGRYAVIVDEVGRLAFPGFVDLLSQAGGQPDRSLPGLKVFVSGKDLS